MYEVLWSYLEQFWSYAPEMPNFSYFGLFVSMIKEKILRLKTFSSKSYEKITTILLGWHVYKVSKYQWWVNNNVSFWAETVFSKWPWTWQEKLTPLHILNNFMTFYQSILSMTNIIGWKLSSRCLYKLIRIRYTYILHFENRKWNILHIT